ncbi:MAG: 3-oxoacyl-ACP reductase FabG [Actinomycetota bacterium]|nr:3-oxoacyl-ACP reductase FabG [Actinomycetota bacterium]
MSRVAVVTGASRGIGRAAAVALARAGHRVACAYHSDDAGAKETVLAVEHERGTAAPFQVDVADEASVFEMFRAIAHWAEAPAVLVNNAGMTRDGLVAKYPLDAFERTVAVNLTGAFLCSRAALPGMLRSRWGRIVNMSSAAGISGNPGQAAYSASKAGVLGLTRSLAREVGKRGITVNAICPGLIETAMAEELGPEARDHLLARTPAGRIGTPGEVAAVVRFLASDDASYVNGAVLTVDGGLTA